MLTRGSLALSRVPGVRSTSDAWAPPFTCELDAVFDHDRTQASAPLVRVGVSP